MIDGNQELQDPSPQSLATYWKNQIKAEENSHAEYREFAESCEKAYRGEGTGSNVNPGKQRYNIFWSNTQILMGALYQATGTPEVRRRQKDAQGPQKDAAMILERALDFCVDSQGFDEHVKRSQLDWLMVGLGQARVLYDVSINHRIETRQEVQPVEYIDEATGVPFMGTESVEFTEEWDEIEAQLARVEFVSWKNFHWEPCKTWEQCNWVAYDHYKSKKEVEDEFGVQGEETDKDDNGENAIKLTEILYKPTRTIIVVGEQFSKPLDVRPDTLGLQGFFNCPKPLLMNVKTDDFQPLSDFWFYRHQAKNLNNLVTRTDNLVRGMKDHGFYDAAFTELSSLQHKDDGANIPVEGLAERMEAMGGMGGVIHKRPIDDTARTVAALQQQIEAKKQEIYEITGLSDIVRGASVASETATAQGIKSQFASVRIRDKQTQMAYFVRDIFRIMAEIIAEHFEPEVLEKMSGMEVTPEVMYVLRDDAMRNFSIDVESDSTLASDEREEQAQRLEALGTITDYVNGLMPAIADGAIPMDLGKEMLLMATRGFKYGGNLEDIISQMGEDNPEAALENMRREVARMGQYIEQLEAELGKTDQLDNYKKEADIRKINAEADKALAETQEQEIENAANTVSLVNYGTTPHAIG